MIFDIIFGNKKFRNALLNWDKKLLEDLIDNGAINGRVNINKNEATTLLYVAINNSFPNFNIQKAILELLLSKGANVNAIDSYGRTPLHEAFKNCDSREIELLLSKGANVNTIDSNGRTPLMEVVERNFTPEKNAIMHDLITRRAKTKLIEDNEGFRLYLCKQQEIQRQIPDYRRRLTEEQQEKQRQLRESEESQSAYAAYYRRLNKKQDNSNVNMINSAKLMISDEIIERLAIAAKEREKIKRIEEIDKSIGNVPCDNSKNTISPNKYKPQYRASDGHMVRSRAELVIDNWLYTNSISHAYEKYLPVTEKVLSDFYLPEHDIYIEFWGLENDSQYNARKKEKLKIYHKYQFRLLELHDSDLLNLEDSLSSKLREFANKKLQKRLNISDGETDDAREVALKQKFLGKRINFDTDDDSKLRPTDDDMSALLALLRKADGKN